MLLTPPTPQLELLLEFLHGLKMFGIEWRLHLSVRNPLPLHPLQRLKQRQFATNTRWPILTRSGSGPI
jgi:hypothetical protein